MPQRPQEPFSGTATVLDGESLQRTLAGRVAGLDSPGLFDPTEGRPDPPEDGYVWGVDVGTRQIAFGFEPGHMTKLLELPKLNGAERLAVSYNLVWAHVRSIAKDVPPLCVWVELPTGKWIAPPLLFMVGVVQAAICDALSKLYAHPVSVFTLTVGEWKKRAVGHGRAEKSDVMDWAVREGASPRISQDEADALAIAHAGRSMIEVPAT